MNISQLAREVASERGSASRVTIRKRIKSLLEEGIVEKGEGYDYKLTSDREPRA
jgi:DNA-binding Lrp family transcriptional regulator